MSIYFETVWATVKKEQCEKILDIESSGKIIDIESPGKTVFP